MYKKVLVAVSIVAILLVAVILFVTGRGDVDAETSSSAYSDFSVYSDGEVVRIFDGGDVEIMFNVGAGKISEEEDPVFGIVKDSPRVEVKVHYISGKQVLLVYGCTLKEVIAEGRAIIFLENCKPAKGVEWFEIIAKKELGIVSLNRNIRTKTAMREIVGNTLHWD